MFLKNKKCYFCATLCLSASLLFAAFQPNNLHAATPASVETYGTIDASGDGLGLPNKPLKAGSLTLPQTATPNAGGLQRSLSRQSSAKLPVGSIVAPQIPQAPTMSSTQQSSSASYMLMQGLRASLQKAGQNPDLPKSSQVAPPSATGPTDVSVVSEQPQPLLKQSQGVAAPVDTTPYRPGMEPRNLARSLSPLPTAPIPEAGSVQDDSGTKTSEVVEQPDPNTATQVASSPACTVSAPASQPESATIEIPVQQPSEQDTSEAGPDQSKQQSVETPNADPAPVPPTSEAGVSALEQKVPPAEMAPPTTEVPAQAAKAASVLSGAGSEHAVKTDNAAKKAPAKKASIFGAPLAESDVSLAEAKSVPSDTPDAPAAATTAPEPKKATAPEQPPCIETTTPWTKNCVDAGYPAAYSGELTGETRVTCPSGDIKDVWLTNSCALSISLKSAKKEAALAAKDEPQSVAPLAAAPAVPQSENNTYASCGLSSGLPVPAAPSVDLCAYGEPSSVNGDGPWHWSCTSPQGMIVSCAAPVAEKQAAYKVVSPLADGLCGRANNVGSDSAPQADDALCAKGIAGRVNGSGPWTWACSGINGGNAVSCLAPKKIDGACGSSNQTATEVMPKNNLCTTGIASAINGSGPWTWTCSGLHGGSADTCAAAQKVEGICGPAHGRTFDEKPNNNLCSSGEITEVSGEGPWAWNCNGLQSGASASCSAQKAVAPVVAKVDVAPKAVRQPVAQPVAMTTPPQSEELALPTPSATLDASSPEAAIDNAASSAAAPVATTAKPSVLGGAVADKTAGASLQTASVAAAPAPVAKPKEPVAPPVACGASANRAFINKPVTDLCEVGRASTPTGTGPWSWTCSEKGKKKKPDQSVTCDALLRVEAVCGSSNGASLFSVPTAHLCDAGIATAVSGEGPWTWSCEGQNGGYSVSCLANLQKQEALKVSGVCGSAISKIQSTAPSSELCESGKPSAVNGEGPWTWSCSGMNGGAASTCVTNKVAPKQPEPPSPAVDANCGMANGAAAAVQPKEGLCALGTPTIIVGNGPWNWNCIGSNGGMSVSCTAPVLPPASIDGVCGSASNIPSTVMPRSGLCDGGISSAVSGTGPWTWSCSGVNGGGAVSCVAPTPGKSGAMPSVVVPVTPSQPAPVPQVVPAQAAAPAAAIAVPEPVKVAPVAKPVAPPAPSLTTPHLDLSKETEAKPQSLVAAQDVPATKIQSVQPLASVVASAPAVQPTSSLSSLPSAAPELPEGTEGIAPPPVRDSLVSSSNTAIVGNQDVGSMVAISSNGAKLDPELSSIPFLPDVEQLDPKGIKLVDQLATVLLARAEIHVTLVGGADNSRGMSPREARRLSLNRSLAVRDELVTHGVSANRIDVRALGANLPGAGNLDRVDVKVNN